MQPLLCATCRSRDDQVRRAYAEFLASPAWQEFKYAWALAEEDAADGHVIDWSAFFEEHQSIWEQSCAWEHRVETDPAFAQERTQRRQQQADLESAAERDLQRARARNAPDMIPDAPWRCADCGLRGDMTTLRLDFARGCLVHTVGCPDLRVQEGAGAAPAPSAGIATFLKNAETCPECGAYRDWVHAARSRDPDQRPGVPDVAEAALMSKSTFLRRRKEHLTDTGHPWPDVSRLWPVLHARDDHPED